MAEKYVKSIVLLTVEDYENFNSRNPILKKGCPVICTIPIEEGQEKKVMMKVGDGTNPFRSLPWLSGLSADVFEWALQETKPIYTANEIAFSDGENFQQKYDNGELTGPAGQSGVYEGSEEPLDPNIKVWIKPDGKEDPKLPEVTSSDNGKILQVVNGIWTPVFIPNGDEVSY